MRRLFALVARKKMERKTKMGLEEAKKKCCGCGGGGKAANSKVLTEPSSRETLSARHPLHLSKEAARSPYKQFPWQHAKCLAPGLGSSRRDWAEVS